VRGTIPRQLLEQIEASDAVDLTSTCSALAAHLTTNDTCKQVQSTCIVIATISSTVSLLSSSSSWCLPCGVWGSFSTLWGCSFRVVLPFRFFQME
jgi:hypothetical protein